MSTLLRRPLFTFLLGAALVGALTTAGTVAYAALGGEQVSACYAPKTGALYVVGRDGAPARCADGHVPIDWSVEGPQGPPGVFSGTFTSPNGAYSLSVTDTGIALSGPGSSVRLTGAEVTVVSSGATTVQAGTTLAVAANDAALQVGHNLTAAVGGTTALQGGNDVTIQSAKRLFLRGTTGVYVDSSSGPFEASAVNALIKASGTVTIKGSKITQN